GPLSLPGVSDVLVNGPGVVWVDRGTGLVDSGARVDSERELRALAHRLVAAAGRRLDDARPFADARMPDGTRVHVVLPPIASQGTTISLRVPPRRTFSLDDLVAAASIAPEGAVLLQRVVAARLSLVVTGGTGTGKTTVLSTLLSEVDPRHRLVLVEDAAELRPRHPHVVRLEARPANAEGAGAVDLSALVRQALRMRPDRLVVGEVRGAEVTDLLAALNTGHEGGCATVHANRPGDVPARFEALGAAAGLSRSTTHAQLIAGLQAVVHLHRDRHGRRVVDSLSVIDADAGIARVRVGMWLAPGRYGPGPAAEALAELVDAA
ncbi:MAG TPA: TadA family conjugal transfer-associated ATPase, partial [Mycobacteriales bacterium]|nr:TadA family conjugal transfer-associated ATPase [Mycobacteriales bacterium]